MPRISYSCINRWCIQTYSIKQEIHTMKTKMTYATYTLIEFSIPSLRHCWIIPSINFGNVIPLNISDFVHRQVPGERNGQVVSQGQNFPALIFQIVYEFRILTVLSRQYILKKGKTPSNESKSTLQLIHFAHNEQSISHLQFENRSINSFSTVLLEDSNDLLHDRQPQGHLLRIVVPGAFGRFE